MGIELGHPNEEDPIPEYLQEAYTRSGKDLNEEQQIAFRNLLLQFQDIFAKNSEEVGKCYINGKSTGTTT